MGKSFEENKKPRVNAGLCFPLPSENSERDNNTR